MKLPSSNVQGMIEQGKHVLVLVGPKLVFGLLCLEPHMVEPRYNEVPRDWENVFIISRVRYKRNPVITNLWENDQNLRYIRV